MREMNVIFDIGSNNGDDIPYYLLKADLVVAFEANPILCQAIRARFEDRIKCGDLVLHNSILCSEADVHTSTLPFFIHKKYDVISQFPEPSRENIDDFERIIVPAMSVGDALENTMCLIMLRLMLSIMIILFYLNFSG